MCEQVAQRRMETMSETNVVHFWDTRYCALSANVTKESAPGVLLSQAKLGEAQTDQG